MSSSQAPMRVDGRTTDTRERVLAKAVELYATKGFTATSLSDIAEQLGITKAAIYYHFPAKADLAKAVFQPFIDDTNALLAQAEVEQPAPRALLSDYFDCLSSHSAVFAAVAKDASPLVHTDFGEAVNDWLERLQELLAGPDPTPEQRVNTLVAVGGLSRALFTPGLTPDEIRDPAIEAALRALGREADRP